MNDEISRRTVLQTSIAGAAMTILPAAAGAQQPAAKTKASIAEDLKRYPLIDAHSHVWSPDTAKWPLANQKTKADLDPPSFTPEELLEQAHAVDVGRVVLIQHTTYHGWDNTYLTDCAAQYPGVFSVVGMVDDTQPHPEVKMKELLTKRVRGFRIAPAGRKGEWLNGAGMAAMWKAGAETGQAMCCLIDAQYLPGVDAMCTKNPQTPVVIDHFARIGVDGMIRDEDLKNLCNLARHKKTHVKVSAYYALGKKQPPYDDLLPMIRRVLDAFGPERTMWASDAPYQVVKGHNYRDSIELIRTRADFLSAGDKDWLLRKTAEKVFFA